MALNSKQFGALNHFAHLQNSRNCQIYASATTVEGIEDMRGTLFCTVESRDVEREIFRTYSVVSIGPRGGVRVHSTSRDVY